MGDSMKVLHIAAWDHGGAGNAAYRLHQSLLEIGVDSHFLCYAKKKEDSTVHGIIGLGSNISTQNQTSSYSPMFTEHFKRWTNYKSLPGADTSIELFSDTVTDLKLLDLPIIQQADVLNFHWMPGLLNMAELPQLSQHKKIVWTLHDMNAFTGGCHYADDCNLYQTQCHSCPQIGQNRPNSGEDLASSMYQLKKKVYDLSSFHVVSPSQWLGQCASESSTFKGKPIDIIPYSLDVSIFQPMDKTQCRRDLNLDIHSKYLLFTAASASTKRKGFDYLVNSLRELPQELHGIKLLVMGNYQPGSIRNCPLEIIPLGHLSDVHTVAKVYSAADVFAIPSLEDNLPNVVLEAQACGTPVVGFDIGGIPDMVTHKLTGFLATKGDVQSFSEGIAYLFNSLGTPTANVMKEACVNNIHAKYLPQHQSTAYLNLYRSLLEDPELNTQKPFNKSTELLNLLEDIKKLIEDGRIQEAMIYTDRLQQKMTQNT